MNINTMYEDGIFEISPSEIKNNVKNLETIFNLLRKDESMQFNIDNFEYNHPDDKTPLKVLNDHLNIDVSVCRGGIEPCKNGVQNALYMRSNIGKIMTDPFVEPNTIAKVFYPTSTYDFPKIEGLNAKRINKVFEKFPREFIQAYKEGKGLKYSVTEKQYSLFSASTEIIQDEKIAAPLKLKLSDESLNALHQDLEQQTKAYTGSNLDINMHFMLEESEYNCVLALNKFLNSDGQDENELLIEISSESSDQFVKTLNLNDQDKQLMNDYVCNHKAVSISLPLSIKQLILGDSKYSWTDINSAAYLEIIINNELSEIIRSDLKQTIMKTIEPLGTQDPGVLDLIGACSATLDIIGYTNNELL
jgi:hypothetical protein